MPRFTAQANAIAVQRHMSATLTEGVFRRPAGADLAAVLPAASTPLRHTRPCKIIPDDHVAQAQQLECSKTCRSANSP
eukprot:137267-Amphidinium_carterae.1